MKYYSTTSSRARTSSQDSRAIFGPEKPETIITSRKEAHHKLLAVTTIVSVGLLTAAAFPSFFGL